MSYRAGPKKTLDPKIEEHTTPKPPVQTNVASINRQYRYWRIRIFWPLFLGYAAFYLVRQNISVAAPEIMKEFGYTKTEIGWIFSLSSIVYGFAKFFNGAICDRTSARYFMSIGLVGTAICVLLIGFSSSIWIIALLYVLSNFFQSMGWPAVARLLTRWFPSRKLGMYWAAMTTSSSVGSAIVLIGGSWLIKHLGWRYEFIIPAVIALLLAGILAERLRDTPESLGLPPVEEKSVSTKVGHNTEKATFKEIFFEYILPNKALWFICIANMFVYAIRMGFINWAPTFLREARGTSIMKAGSLSSAFEIAGIVGALAAGWLSDRFSKNRRSRTAFYFMVVLMISLFLFWQFPTQSLITNILFLSMIGAFTYGPHMITGLAAAEFGSKNAAAAANGLAGTFGYVGGAISGVVVGWIADHLGWNSVFIFFCICAALGAFFLTLNWNKTPQSVAKAIQKA